MSLVEWRKPRFHISLIFLGMVVVFCFAARWQWQRATFKEVRAAAFTAAMNLPAQRRLGSALAAPASAGFDRVMVDGTLDGERLILLDNQIRDGKFGVEVYALLVSNDGMHVLAGLGWVASDPSRQQLPKIPAIPNPIHGEGLLTDPPAAGLQLGASSAIAQPTFPLLLTRIDPVQLRSLLRVPDLADRIVQLAPDTASGFLRQWQLSGLSADKHRGYALQWISFAIGTLVFFVLWHRPRKGKSS